MTLNRVPEKIWQDPRLFIAFGLGSGAMPCMPGTFGTMMALPFYGLMAYCSKPIYTLIVGFMLLLGCYLCQYAADCVGEHDHSGIVIDEFVGLWISLAWITPTVSSVILGVALFRLFDIVKPWPITWLDRQVKGGLGIMLDDVVAGLAAALVLALFGA